MGGQSRDEQAGVSRVPPESSYPPWVCSIPERFLPAISLGSYKRAGSEGETVLIQPKIPREEGSITL